MLVSVKTLVRVQSELKGAHVDSTSLFVFFFVRSCLSACVSVFSWSSLPPCGAPSPRFKLPISRVCRFHPPPPPRTLFFRWCEPRTTTPCRARAWCPPGASATCTTSKGREKTGRCCLRRSRCVHPPSFSLPPSLSLSLEYGDLTRLPYHQGFRVVRVFERIFRRGVFVCLQDCFTCRIRLTLSGDYGSFHIFLGWKMFSRVRRRNV